MTRPIIALLYDFDKTLCTTDMENYTFIPALGYTPAQFWQKANGFGRDNHMDGLLAYMYTMIHECREQNRRLDRDFLVRCGRDMVLFPGVREWFRRINAFGQQLGVEIEHYVISSGLREIIEGSGIAHEFREIYACEFFYDEEGLACWPKLDVNFTNKTQFVYRINKGVLDVSDDKTLNDSMPDDSKRIPFTNMIYVGDGLSDVPCMKMMRTYGGQAIAVYQEENRQGVEDLLSKGRVDFIFPADFREGTALDSTVKISSGKWPSAILWRRKTPPSSVKSGAPPCPIRPVSSRRRKRPLSNAEILCVYNEGPSGAASIHQRRKNQAGRSMTCQPCSLFPWHPVYGIFALLFAPPAHRFQKRKHIGLILLRGIHIKHHPAATDLCCEIRWAINGIDLTGSGTAFCHLTGDGEGRSGIDAAAAVCGIQPTEV